MKKKQQYFRLPDAVTMCFIFVFLMHTGKLFSQDEASFIRQKSEMNRINNYQEKIFLHINKTVYATGEIVWFKAYITDAASNKFSPLSKICYVEILNADNKPVLQAKIDVDSGRGNGSFLLPASIRTGNYVMRAYTNWMKNFDQQFYFQENITIINPNKKPGFTQCPSPKAFIQFFPEGGNLVYGLKSTVAFKATDTNGSGINATGFILSAGKDTITSFKTAKFGMGTFSFTPAAGDSYKALVHLNDTTLTQPLPSVYNNGFVMHLEDIGNTLSIRVTGNTTGERNVLLVAESRDSITVVNMQPLNNGIADFLIKKSQLGEGISQITVFNEQQQPLCERLYFKRPGNLLQLKVNATGKEYAKRSKVDLSISATDTNGNSIDANMSVSVHLIDSLEHETPTNLVNYMWFFSDIKGRVESPEYYFQNNSEATTAADNLMLTQGWRRYKWGEILSAQKRSFNYLPEHTGHIISGKLILKSGDGSKDTGVTVYLSVPGKNFQFANAYASSSGRMLFNVEKFYGNRQLIVQTNAVDSNYRLLIDEPFSDEYTQRFSQPLFLNPALSNEMLLRSIGAQSQSIYDDASQQRFTLPPSFDSTAFFGNGSKRYNLDAYTRFPTMEEVIREYVKEVHLRKKDKNYHFEVFNEPDISYFNNEPLVLIDGVPVFNDNKIIDIDPLKIKKIDVTTTRFYRGSHEYDGIISFATYNGDLNGYQLDPNALVVEYDGLQYQREFYSPTYATPAELASRLPDYRNALYWNPEVENKQGENHLSFYTSDVPGNYVICVQGISANGLVGSSNIYFTVLPSK